MSSIFYKIDKNVDVYSLMDEVVKVSEDIHIDILKSITRETYNISVEECLEIFKSAKHMHWVFIERNDSIPIFLKDKELNNYYEIGGCTMCHPGGDVFLFIYLSKSKGDKLLEQYKLKRLNCF